MGPRICAGARKGDGACFGLYHGGGAYDSSARLSAQAGRLNAEQFSRYYRYQHIKAAGDQRIPSLIRYVQSHRAEAPPSQADFNAVAEVWLESEAELAQFCASPQYKEFRADELNFVDTSRTEALTTVDHVILDGERRRAWSKRCS